MSQTPKCKVCCSGTDLCFTSFLMNKNNVNYYKCTNCGFLQTEEPYWLEEAYSRPINISDTGYLHRNIHYSNMLTTLICLFFDRKAKFLDYAGGYGVFVRLMRDIGFDFCWDDKYTKNLFVFGFEWDMTSDIEAITAFECFEHFVEPIVEFEKIMSISKNIIFSTDLLPDPVPKPAQWWYYGLDHGQHISFYTERTLQFIAHKYGLNYSRIGNLHLLTEDRVSPLKLKLLRLNRFGMPVLFKKLLKSKTWDDFSKVSSVDYRGSQP